MEALSLKSMSFHSGEALQAQLYQQLVERIFNGYLPPGTRLPSSRIMAQELCISRNTITVVIDQLKSEGLVQTRMGSGVFITHDLPTENSRTRPTERSCSDALPTLSSFGESLSSDIDRQFKHSLPFAPGLPDMTEFPVKTWSKIQRRHEERQKLMGFGGGQGYRPLKEALAHHLKTSRGVNCEENNIIITQGAQQALTLCALVLLNEGDTVLMESPCYMGAYRAFLARNINVTFISAGNKGLDVDQLPESTKTKLVYTTPTHQYPLGGMMSTKQRIKLLSWASQKKHWVIEDDYDSDFHFHEKPVDALQGMKKQAPVIYIGSFSKTLYPSLRLGYMVVPRKLVPIFIRTKLYVGGESPLLSQATVADFISEGHFVKHLRRMRKLYQSKWEHAAKLIEQHLTGLASPIVESAGMQLTIKVNVTCDKWLQAELLKLGYGSVALSSYYAPSVPDFSVQQGLVLGLANTSDKERVAVILALKSLLLKA